MRADYPSNRAQLGAIVSNCFQWIPIEAIESVESAESIESIDSAASTDSIDSIGNNLSQLGTRVFFSSRPTADKKNSV